MRRFFNFIKSICHGFVAFFPWYASLYKGRRWYTRLALGAVSAVVFFFLYLGMVDINFLWLFGKSPGFLEINTPPTYAASEVYSADSVLIGKFFKENRTPVKFEDVNPVFWDALISTEDERFYSHHGIDFMGVAGAVKDAVTRSEGRGASTITQQLAKNMFRVRTQYSTGLLGKIPGLRILIMKSKEWIIATKLELIYDKNDILTMYANTVDFGNNAYGINTACKTYFNTTPKKLTTDQAAILVGMLKATTYYSPVSHPQNAIARRNVVLGNMVSHGRLSKADYELYSKKPIKLDMHVEENYDGQAQYFREAVANYLKGWAKDNGYDLYSSGLKIYTTLDTRMQKYAEEAATKQMRIVQRNFDNHWRGMEPWRDEHGQPVKGFIEGIIERQPFYKALCKRYNNNMDSVRAELERPHMVKVFDYEKGTVEREMSSIDSVKYMVSFMHCAMVAMEPRTGAVRAWVGDIDFNSWKYDKVTAERQPGSTFKLFVYSEAMNQGFYPCERRRDEPVGRMVPDEKTHVLKYWNPGNANGRFSYDSIPLKKAFAQSINSIAVKLGDEVHISNVIETAHKMGINSPLKDQPSLALGTSDVNLLEMANAYSTIADDGTHHTPVLVTRILDKDGNEVYTGPIDETSEGTTYKTAYLMQQMLMAGVKEGGGTSRGLQSYILPGTDWGGKTGTTQNHSDAWFMAVSPKLVVGAWVGGEYRSIHFRTGALGQGAKTALPICGEFIRLLFNDSNFRDVYKGTWPKADEDEVDPALYECTDEVIPAQTSVDSLSIYEQHSSRHASEAVEGEDEENAEALDNEENTEGEEGNAEVEPPAESNKPKSSQKKAKQHAQEGETSSSN